MEPVYILIKIKIDGRVEASMTTNPEVPEGFILPGEIAFTVHPIDFAARHTHGFEQ